MYMEDITYWSDSEIQQDNVHSDPHNNNDNEVGHITPTISKRQGQSGDTRYDQQGFLTAERRSNANRHQEEHPRSIQDYISLPSPLIRSPSELRDSLKSVQSSRGSTDRRFIQTNSNADTSEQLGPRYRRVKKDSYALFFNPGRVFKMLWSDPLGQVNPGKTRNSTHFSTIWPGEQVFAEIRRFFVVRNRGTFSHCIPVQTYAGRGATKPGLVMNDHGIIYTTPEVSQLLAGEVLTKIPIHVVANEGEHPESTSRVNYGKSYAVEHNVKLLDIGMVSSGHRDLIQAYFDAAMRGL